MSWWHPHAAARTEWGPSMTLTMSLTWMLFCSESRATAKRLSFFLVTAWCRTVTTFPYMFSTCSPQGGQGAGRGPAQNSPPSDSTTPGSNNRSWGGISGTRLHAPLILFPSRTSENRGKHTQKKPNAAPSSAVAARAHLEGLALQADDDAHGLGVQLHQLTPLVLPPNVHARGSLRAELQVPR